MLPVTGMKPFFFNLCRELGPQRSLTGFKIEIRVPHSGSFPGLVQKNHRPAKLWQSPQGSGREFPRLAVVGRSPSIRAVCIVQSTCFPENSALNMSPLRSNYVPATVSISWNHDKDSDLKPPCHDGPGNRTKPTTGLCAPWFPCQHFGDSEAAVAPCYSSAQPCPPLISWVPEAQSIWVLFTWTTMLFFFFFFGISSFKLNCK